MTTAPNGMRPVPNVVLKSLASGSPLLEAADVVTRSFQASPNERFSTGATVTTVPLLDWRGGRPTQGAELSLERRIEPGDGAATGCGGGGAGVIGAPNGSGVGAGTGPVLAVFAGPGG